jgi:ferredoxin
VTSGEQSLLDISVANKIPHWRECGGNGRCTTCRVRVLHGSTNLSPRSKREDEVAEARGWDPSVRLACQTRLLGEATIERIVLRGADTSQLQLETVGGDAGEERMVALLFCDMRGFTRFAEAHSAFDVVHILNRFFASVGEPILVNGGIIYQYVGDEISGLFGLDGGSPRRACESANLRSELPWACAIP